VFTVPVLYCLIAEQKAKRTTVDKEAS